MQPHKKKVLIMMAVSSGIIVFAFLLPIAIIPAYLGVSGASNCAISSSCAGDTFSRCGAYGSSSESTSFADSLERGTKGMLCMLGLDKGTVKAILQIETDGWAATLNKLPLHILN